MENKDFSKVLDIDKKERKETIEESLINRVEETIEVGNAGYARDIAFPIPVELVEENENIKRFIKNMGKMSRDPSYGLDIGLEHETRQDIAFITFVVDVQEEVNLDKIKTLLGGK